MVAPASALPRWDMDIVFPGLRSPEFEAARRGLFREIDELAALFDGAGVGVREPAPLDERAVADFDEAVGRYNALLDRARLVEAYIYAFVATDSRDAVAQARRSELELRTVALAQLGTRFTAWIGSLDVEALFGHSATARAHEHVLRRARVAAAHQMSPAEEDLAAELSPTGGGAWGQLHMNLTSQLAVPIELNGERTELPMSVVRNLAHEPERETRRVAYEAELKAWERAALPLATALNSIKGEVNTLTRRRGWGGGLEAALFDNDIDRATLDAMLEAARESFPDFRRYLRAKARALGQVSLPWFDMFAPIGKSSRVWEFDDARRFVVEQFRAYSPRLSEFAARTFSERWIDAEPRAGKRDGAFCMALRRDESRVFMNYKPTFASIRTLAHELGHAYHNLNLAPRSVLQQGTPMILAETASTFCEMVIRDAGLRNADTAEQLEILEGSIQAACQFVVDITSRFIFESAVFDQRRQRELSVEELCAAMLDAQRQTYGDGLDQGHLHPYMWAVKGHYFSSGLSFYNFPYMFGLLFALGLYDRFQEDAASFRDSYDELLSLTGMADPASLAAHFGIDIRRREFWRSSLDVVRANIDRFEALIG